MINLSDPKAALAALQSQTNALATKEKALKENLPHLYGQKWYQWAWDFFKSENRVCLLCAANQISKAVILTHHIPTPNGTRLIGDLRAGDFVFGSDGKPAKILSFPWQGEDEAYEFEFDDGVKVTTTKDHVWIAKDYDRRFRKEYTDNRPRSKTLGEKFPNKNYGHWGEFSTKEIFTKCGENPSPAKRFSIPLCEPLDYPNPKKVFDAYALGLLLGDGSLSKRSITFTNPDSDLLEYLENLSAVRINYSDKNKCASLQCSFAKKPLEDLNLLGTVSDTKFIPEDYFLASIEDRKSLLAGLMDTDGTALKHGVFYYSTTSERLAGDVSRLVSSLGGKTRIKYRKVTGYKNKAGEFVQCKPTWEVYTHTSFNPFRLKRKADRWHPSRYAMERVIRYIRPVGKVKARCLEVDSKDHSFLFTENCIVTHNSSTQIRKAIHWATYVRIWPRLWPNKKPRVFWYFYPNLEVATVEFREKWAPEFLPRNEYKDHPIYGWEAIYDKKFISELRFKTGVTIYFKAYSQKVSNLQSTSVDAMFTDEEMPVDFYSELMARMYATDGYFSMVFTATLNQEFWKRAIEGIGDTEVLPDAFKLQVSMYDCQVYKDGTPGAYSLEKIKRIEAGCKSPQEIERRVNGKFTSEIGLKYGNFDPTRHYVKPFSIPKNYLIWAAVDIGSGGENHKPAIAFVAVAPDFRKGYVCKGWRGDDGSTYTAGDCLEKFRDLRGPVEKLTAQHYDQGSVDFGQLAARAGESFQKSVKSHEIGEQIINTLFKNDMLFIFDTPELQKLGGELSTLKRETAKNKAKDDFCDAMRYAVTAIPWDWSHLIGQISEMEKIEHEKRPLTEKEQLIEEINIRRGLGPQGRDTWAKEERDPDLDYWQSEFEEFI